LNTGLSSAEITKSSAPKGGVLPNALIQVKDATGLGSKVGIAREKPASMLPGRSASLLSQRHKVAPLISATSP